MVELLSTESLQVSRGVGLVTTLVFTFQPLNLYAIVFILFIIYLHIIVFYIHIV